MDVQERSEETGFGSPPSSQELSECLLFRSGGRWMGSLGLTDSFSPLTTVLADGNSQASPHPLPHGLIIVIITRWLIVCLPPVWGFSV